ncbi:SDR family NAD(P)-dependent oxidoreductase [Paenibacillus sp. NPDC058174]|uniref:SDR family NAD(P)-dependent oxidoreductase n=1 Tax=Paenibacillus sp. NPDC058174 TaxID=3346366 RepID=UPI0036D9EB50
MTEQHTALITGADRGVGLALAAQLLDKGWQVIAGKYLTQWKGLEELQSRYPDQLRIVELNVGDDQSVAAAVRQVSEWTNKLDMVINNAAILGDIQTSIGDELNFDEMLQAFNVNSLGALRVTNGFLPQILRSEGKLIVNISSEAGSVANCWRTGWFGYAMSKSALNMQSMLVHRGLKDKGGRVLLLHPGHVQSYMQGELDNSGKYTPEQSAAAILKLAQRRLGDEWNGEELALIDPEGQVIPW